MAHLFIILMMEQKKVALVEIVFNAGNSFENKNSVAAAANHLLKNGTSKKSALEIMNTLNIMELI